MKYKEWIHLKIIEDNENPFSTLFQYPSGERFYIEPIFYSKFTTMLDHHPKSKGVILKEMERQVKLNKKIVFTGAYDMPCTHKENYIYLELEDLTNKLLIFVEDKSRGSDYGD